MQDLRELIARGGVMGSDRRLQPPHAVRCPRCDSLNTKFCYYNNYNLSQPRHFCKSCRRYWTRGGVLRNVPVGGGCRKTKRSSSPSSSSKRKPNPRPDPPASAPTTAPPSLNPADQNPTPAAALAHHLSPPAYPGHCSFTSLIGASNQEFLAREFHFVGDNHHPGNAAGFPLHSEEQEQPEAPATLRGVTRTGATAEGLLGIAKAAAAGPRPPTQGFAVGGWLTPLDWQSSVDQELLDAARGIDLAHWGRCQWGDGDQVLYLP